MTDPISQHSQENPSSDEVIPSHVTPGYKRLKFIVVFMGVLIVVGLGVIITTVVYRAFNSSDENKVSNAQMENVVTQENPQFMKAFGNMELIAPKNSTFKSVNGVGGYLFFHFSTPEGDVVKVLDISTGKIMGTINLVQEQ